jgi:hypothetical protein
MSSTAFAQQTLQLLMQLPDQEKLVVMRFAADRLKKVRVAQAKVLRPELLGDEGEVDEDGSFEQMMATRVKNSIGLLPDMGKPDVDKPWHQANINQ